MKAFLWYFWCYSFLGWGIECGFAHLTHSPVRRRRCLLFLPLCPVYGFGMTAVLALPAPLLSGWRVVLTGAVAATMAEYLYHWVCEALLGVRFWDYSNVPLNLHGRVCLPFSLAWGGLVFAALHLLHPAIVRFTALISPLATLLFLLIFTLDSVCTVYFLRITHDLAALRHAWA